MNSSSGSSPEETSRTWPASSAPGRCRIDGLNAYRLAFDDATAADSGREKLSTNSDVASVEDNYSIDRPPEAGLMPPNFAGGAAVNLQLKPPPDDGSIIIGLVDTAVQALCETWTAS